LNRATASRLAGPLIQVLNRLLRAAGIQIVTSSALAAIKASTELPERHVGAQASQESRAYLRVTNPRLVELRQRYAGHPAAARSHWTPDLISRQVDLSRFRADSPYVWSERDAYVSLDGTKTRVATRAVNSVLSAYYVREHDHADVLGKAGDDGLFGNRLVAVDERLAVSRDLLDSALEINFLDRHLGISAREQLTVLDVGAGYGRFAHRMAQTFPNVRTLCTDGIPESTFLAEYYLRFRGVEANASVLPLDELDSLAPGAVGLAVNIHSWSECPIDVIEWWVAFLSKRRVPNLFIVPNDGERLLSLESDGARQDFAPLLQRHGYQRVALEPKYGATSVQQLGAYPAHYHLFALDLQ
jgi:SAM-dependent methyltransferase